MLKPQCPPGQGHLQGSSSAVAPSLTAAPICNKAVFGIRLDQKQRAQRYPGRVQAQVDDAASTWQSLLEAANTPVSKTLLSSSAPGPDEAIAAVAEAVAPAPSVAAFEFEPVVPNAATVQPVEAVVVAALPVAETADVEVAAGSLPDPMTAEDDSLVAAAADAVTDSVAEAASAVSDAADAVSSGMVELNDSLSGASSSLTSSVNLAADSLTAGFSDAAGAVAGAADTLTSSLSGAAGAVTGSLGGAADTVSSSLTGAVDAVSGGISGAADAVTGSISSAADAVSSQISNLTGAVTGTASGVTRQLTGVAEGAVNELQTELGAVTGAVGGIFNSINSQVESTTSGISSAVAGVTSTVNGYYSSVLSAFSNQFAAVDQAVSGTVQQVQVQVDQAVSLLPSPAQDVVRTVGGAAVAHPEVVAALTGAYVVKSTLDAYQRRYGGYSGELEPTQVLNAMADEDVCVLDIRSAEQIAEEGVLRVKLAARFKIAAVPYDVASALVRDMPASLVNDKQQLFYAAAAVAYMGLKQVAGINTQIIVMDNTGSDLARNIARALESETNRRAYVMKGGFQQWKKDGLEVLENKTEYEAGQLAIIQDEIEQITEQVQEAVVPKLLDPAFMIPASAGFAFASYAIYNYHTTLKYLGVWGIFATIYWKLAQYSSVDELLDDIKGVAAGAAKSASLVASAASKSAASRPAARKAGSGSAIRILEGGSIPGEVPAAAVAAANSSRDSDTEAVPEDNAAVKSA